MSTVEAQQPVQDGATDRRSDQTTDRRSADNHPLNILLTRVSDDVTSLTSDVRDLRILFAQHSSDETLALAEAVAALMIKSFPAGDPDGHKKYHEAQMKAAEDKALFWSKMRFELSRAGLLGFILWVGVQLWKGVLTGPQA